MKIVKDETNIYSGNCYVNNVIFRDRIYGEFHEVGQGGIKFALQLSNGKDKTTDEWFKPTFAVCTAFGDIAKRILKEYKPKDEIWIIAKYYSKQHYGKYYKGFIVRDIISEREITDEASKSQGYRAFENVTIYHFKEANKCNEILKGFGLRKNCGC